MRKLRPKIGDRITFNCWEVTEESPEGPDAVPWSGVVTAIRSGRMNVYAVKRDYDGARVELGSHNITGYLRGQRYGSPGYPNPT